jgi:hypothetical protein
MWNEGRSWEYIFTALPYRSEGSIRVRCSTKFKKRPRTGADRSWTGGAADCFIGVRALVSEKVEPSSRRDDDNSSDGDSSAEQGRWSTSKHSLWSDLDEQRLLAYKRQVLGTVYRSVPSQKQVRSRGIRVIIRIYNVLGIDISYDFLQAPSPRAVTP